MKFLILKMIIRRFIRAYRNLKRTRVLNTVATFGKVIYLITQPKGMKYEKVMSHSHRYKWPITRSISSRTLNIE
jgi:hypothetical protein